MRKRYIIDCEVYSNYFLMSAMDIDNGDVVYFEKSDYHRLDVVGLSDFLSDNLTVSFNGLNYDLPIIARAIKGATNGQIKTLSDKIVTSNEPSWKICKEAGIVVPKTWDHIDLFEVAPGRSGLKIYGGRLHQQRLQDLPVEVGATLTEGQMSIVKDYCVNDLLTTKSLLSALRNEVNLRIDIGKQYKMDVRSKSDAQIAEAIILHELTRITGKSYGRPDNVQASFRYKDPGFISFESEGLSGIFKKILNTDFLLGANGAVLLPDWLEEPILIDGSKYQMGIGGLHSMEKTQYISREDGMLLEDYDVASYYPSIILQQRLFPEAIGDEFVDIYQDIVTRRLRAKAEGNKTVADTFKIVLNASFGKFGSKYSKFYSPDLFIQTTITGQLALMMLIERLTGAGIKTVSANTDGIVLYYPVSMARDVEVITFDWSLDTSYALEKTPYKVIASRDVNSYLAVKLDGSIKGKGCFAKPSLSKNPDMLIVYRAVMERVSNGTPVDITILSSEDIREFVCVRRVQGGAVWRGETLGKVVRFYYSSSVDKAEAITYSTNGNRVPKSNGSKPVMNLPATLPDDIDYDVYIVAANKLLKEIGFEEK